MTEDLHQLAGAYALDALSDEEREQFEAHLSDCDDCQAEVADFRDTTAMLGAGVAEPAPEGMRSRVLDAIEHTPQEPGPVEGRRGEPSSVPPTATGWQSPQTPQKPQASQGPASLDAARERREQRKRFDFRHSSVAAAAAAVAVVAVVAAGSVIGQRLSDESRPGGTPAWVEDARTASLEGSEGVDARFAYHPEGDRGLLLVDGLEPVDPDRNVYQLWLFHDEQPVPAGVFTTDEDGTAQVPATARVAGAELVAVTVEPPGGSAQPSSDPILAGEL